MSADNLTQQSRKIEDDDITKILVSRKYFSPLRRFHHVEHESDTFVCKNIHSVRLFSVKVEELRQVQ